MAEASGWRRPTRAGPTGRAGRLWRPSGGSASVSDGLIRITSALRRAAPRAGATRVVAVDGRSGAGKTSLAAALAGLLDAPVVSLEGLYGGWDGLEHGIDLLVSAVLRPLAAGQATRVPRYDWVAREWAEPCCLSHPRC